MYLCMSFVGIGGDSGLTGLGERVGSVVALERATEVMTGVVGVRVVEMRGRMLKTRW